MSDNNPKKVIPVPASDENEDFNAEDPRPAGGSILGGEKNFFTFYLFIFSTYKYVALKLYMYYYRGGKCGRG
jgi:hypothetical protein